MWQLPKKSLKHFFDSCVIGYRVYQEEWDRQNTPLYLRAWKPSRYFHCKGNKAGVTIGHVPKKISSTFSLFISNGGVISCEVTEPNRRDLPQGGLVYLSFKAMNN